MTSAHDIDLHQFLTDRLTDASPDLLRSLLSTFIDALMGAEADSLCGAGFGERSENHPARRSRPRRAARRVDRSPPLSRPRRARPLPRHPRNTRTYRGGDAGGSDRITPRGVTRRPSYTTPWDLTVGSSLLLQRWLHHSVRSIGTQCPKATRESTRSNKDSVHVPRRRPSPAPVQVWPTSQ